jgi:hypothetical protein
MSAEVKVGRPVAVGSDKPECPPLRLAAWNFGLASELERERY